MEWVESCFCRQGVGGTSHLSAGKILTLHWREEDLRHGCSLGPFVLRDRLSMTGLTAQSHIALHHWVPCHGAHWGRRRDWAEGQIMLVI